ncbi:MAG: DUF817 domain-containing protein [Pseudobdellovibrionaceae bacterium]
MKATILEILTHSPDKSRLHNALIDFLHFGLKQVYASLFGGALLVGILASKLFWPDEAPLARYDALFIYALVIQSAFLALKLETWEEARVILVFHLIGTAMEIFKTYAGSWEYPEDNLIRIGGVPLFSGFMYSAVGSYIARVWRIFDFRFTNYPPKLAAALLCLAIYINFFAHHYLPDMRYALFAITLLLFARTRVYFTPNKTHYWMPLLIGWGLVALFIWIAENVGTFGAIWVYPSQKAAWHIVSPEKIGSWYLLMIISFVLVTFIHKEKKNENAP